MAAAPEYMTDEQATERGLRERMKAIIGDLEREAEDRVSKRRDVEDRWLEDLAQYHGRYDPKTESALTKSEKSRLFVNQTRPKTGAMEARLSDMLFPTDDKNWGIGPSPVPELTLEAETVAEESAAARKYAAEHPDDPQAQSAAAMAMEASRLVQARMDEARRRARAMEEEIDDHLRFCNYASQSREVIHDACKLGTGVMKGPVIGEKGKRAWVQSQDGYALDMREDDRPVFWRVDPWSFFPDMDARVMDECESVFERHLMNAKQMRRLARQPGFDADAIRRLLTDQPRHAMPTYIADLRTLTQSGSDDVHTRYHVWEYHGPLEAEHMLSLAMATGKEDMLEDFATDDIDPLTEIHAVVWFCQGEVLKFGIHPLDSGEPVYSVFNLERDETSLFGYGVPYIIRHPQKALNAGWRVMLENAGLSSGPQIVVNRDVIEPSDGVWSLLARKLWFRKSTALPNQAAFETYNITSNQKDYREIIEMARKNIDEESNIPLLAQGEQGSHITQTAHGMNLLMNSVNVVFRRVVKNWDDDMTTPNIRRVYDWLMQFSPKEHIKGDYEVDARGSSVLLVREMQTANMMAFLMNFAAHPVLGRFLKDEGLHALRRLAQSLMIPADELIKSDDEIADEEAEAAAQPPQPHPEIMEIEAKMNLAQMEWDSRKEIAMMQRETEMMKLAASQNMKLEELRSKLFDQEQEREARERGKAVEVAMTREAWERGQSSGGGRY